jgi:hypothetical protein
VLGLELRDVTPIAAVSSSSKASSNDWNPLISVGQTKVKSRGYQ